jgi:hypothetical protein
MRLKSWESPRHEGRNSKGKGGSARARQLKKQQQTLRKQLKAQSDRQNHQQNNQQNNKGKETHISFPYFIFVLASSHYPEPLIGGIFLRHVVECRQLRSRRVRREIVFWSWCRLISFRTINLPPSESNRHSSSTQSKSQ